jgi:hypothetical protein
MRSGRGIGANNVKYFNPETKLKIDLGDLADKEKKFYREALGRFQRKADWLSFDQFAFDLKSPIYSGRRAHLDVLKDPLFLALKDMSLQLGVQQGMIARSPKATVVAVRRSHRARQRSAKARPPSLAVAR